MSLSAGARLGAYEILGLLGTGGMGEVYRARDTRLGRTVAIKILSSEHGWDAQARDRFEREARTISTLDHPHICALFDVGDEQGTPYLVMPCLDGETLADRLRKGALPFDGALRIGVAIADALAAAHRAGIVHRDVKPGNVMLTKNGVRLLDFGLAKPVVSTPGPAASIAATEAPLTARGSLSGTFEYMAPEQLEGSRVDARSDIWALGCVLYEMVSGRKAFGGGSQASVIGGIMSASPRPLAEVMPIVCPRRSVVSSRAAWRKIQTIDSRAHRICPRICGGCSRPRT
jgi:serine/threonine protein kinase